VFCVLGRVNYISGEHEEREKSRARLAAKMGEEPEEERKAETQNEASDDGKIKRGVFAAVDDVAWESSQAERKLSTEVKKSTYDHEEAAEEQDGAAEFTERIHKSIIKEGSAERRELTEGCEAGIDAHPSSPFANKQIEAASAEPKEVAVDHGEGGDRCLSGHSRRRGTSH